jgi:hypothetical protein
MRIARAHRPDQHAELDNGCSQAKDEPKMKRLIMAALIASNLNPALAETFYAD